MPFDCLLWCVDENNDKCLAISDVLNVPNVLDVLDVSNNHKCLEQLQMSEMSANVFYSRVSNVSSEQHTADSAGLPHHGSQDPARNTPARPRPPPPPAPPARGQPLRARPAPPHGPPPTDAPAQTRSGHKNSPQLIFVFRLSWQTAGVRVFLCAAVDQAAAWRGLQVYGAGAVVYGVGALAQCVAWGHWCSL